MLKNKNVIIFLLKFFGAYFIMFILYSTYLNQNQQTDVFFSCAPITKDVADKSVWVVQMFGYDSYVEQSSHELSLTMYIKEKAVSRIIEGCNAVSIIILFVAFIIAFSSKFWRTFLYALFGSLLIYYVNIFRVAVIGIALYEYPENQDFLHEILFPAIIYGLVLILWFLWIRKFSKIKNV